jgi:hypothetical protein
MFHPLSPRQTETEQGISIIDAAQKAPSTNLQAPEKLQSDKTQKSGRDPELELECLVLLWSLDVGASALPRGHIRQINNSRS